MRIGVGLSIPELATRGGRFSPASLFTAGTVGAWFDPSDYSTLFQDSAGTTPVTAVEQPVGLMLDKSQGLVLGSELVTNGDFSGGTTGWTAGNSATLSVTGGKLSVVNGALALGQGRQTITTVAGKTYKISVTFTSVSASRGYVFVGTFAGDNSRFSAGPLTTSQTVTGYFTAAGTSTYLSIGNADNSIGLEVQFDDVTVKEIAGNHASQATAASRPVLRARYNLLTYSEQFDNAVWTKSNSFVQTNLLLRSEEFDVSATWVQVAASVTPNATTSPEGAVTADKLIEDATTGVHSIYQAYSAVSGTIYTMSFYAKAAERTWVRTRGDIGVNYFNLAAGTVGTTASGVTATIIAVGNGWYRCIATKTSATTGVTNSQIAPTTADNVDSYAGTAGSGVFIWGAQLVQGAVPGDYRATTSAALPILYTSPIGTLTANSLVAGTTGPQLYQTFTIADNTVITGSVYLKKVSGSDWAYIRIREKAGANYYLWANLATGATGTTSGSPTAFSVTSVGSGWYRLSISGSSNTGATTPYLYVASADANGSGNAAVNDTILIWGADLRTGSSAGTYQRIAAATDYATAGFLPYLAFDGSDDSFGTNSINFSATDKMSVCAGVTKLSDVSVGVVAELAATDVGNNGIFAMFAPLTSGTFSFRSKGTGLYDANASSLNAPITRVAVGISDIANDVIILRLNGVQAATNTSDQGTGNFGNYPLFIGRRNNSSLPFNGRMYGLIVAGKTLSASELSATESWMNSKTGAY